MEIRWSAQVLDTLIAPGLSAFRHAVMPDLQGMFPQAEHWLENQFLDSLFGPKYPPRLRSVAIGFMRRARGTLRAYQSARDSTLVFLEKSKPASPAIRQYYEAVTDWEKLALQSNMAIALFRYLNGGQGAFKKGDGSPEERIYEIGNDVKHAIGSAEDRIEPLPLWLCDEGLQSHRIMVTYSEVSEVVQAISALADELQSPARFAQGGEKGAG